MRGGSKGQPASLIGVARWQDHQSGRSKFLQCRCCHRHVGHVHRIKRAAEQDDGFQRWRLFAYLTIAKHHPFLRGQALKSDRAAGMQFIGRNADFRAKSIFKPIRESR